MSTIEVYVSTSKTLSKLGRAKTGVELSFSLTRVKLRAYSSPPMKLALFEAICDGSDEGDEVVDKPLVEGC